MPLAGATVTVTDAVQNIDEWEVYHQVNGGGYALDGTYTCPYVDSGSGEGATRIYTFACPCTIPADASVGDVIQFQFVPAGYDADLVEFIFESDEYTVTEEDDVIFGKNTFSLTDFMLSLS